MSAFTSRATKPEEDPEVLRLAQRLGTTAEPPPVGFWDGGGSATLEGLPRGALEAKATLEQAVGGTMDALRSVGASINFNTSEEDYEAGLGDAGFKRFQEAEEQYLEDSAATAAKVAETRRQAAEFRPDPMSTGLAGQIGNEFAALIPRTAAVSIAGGPAAGAAAAGIPAGQAETERLEREGVDPATAQQVGAVNAVSTAVGVALPAAGILRGPVKDAAAAMAGNVGLGVAERASSGALLREAGYHEQAAQFDAMDRTAAAIDASLSLLFSGAHHVSSRNTSALLTARNADHFARGDGLVPVDPRSGAIADAAKTRAVEALQEGVPLNLGAEVEDAAFLIDPFRGAPSLPDEVHQVARAASTTADLYDQAAERIIQLESGGRADAKNPRSSATGAGQFIDSTWLEMIRRHRPDLAAFKTTGEILALRLDPALSADMVAQLARDNGQALEKAGITPTPSLLYAAHHFGIGKAIEFARAGDDTPMTAILSAGKIEANRYLEGMTKAQLLANWAKRGLSDEQARAETVPRALAEDATPARIDEPTPTRRPMTDEEPARSPSIGARVVDFMAALRRPPADSTARESNAGDQVAGTPSQPPARPQLPADPQIAAALQVATEIPDHPILAGYDADGVPVFRTLANATEEIHADFALASREAEAFTAGANCYLSRGGI